MIEIEFKFPIEPNLAERLQKKICALQQENLKNESDQSEVDFSEEFQGDEYFNHKLLAFDKTDIALRMRQVDNQFTLTYKGPGQDKQAKIRDEVEIKFNQCDANKMKSILSGLGMYSVATVNKTRRGSKLRWNEFDVFVCFDTVEKVGTFVELEIVVENESEVQTAKAQLASLATALDLQNSIKTSYLELLLEQENLSAGKP